MHSETSNTSHRFLFEISRHDDMFILHTLKIVHTCCLVFEVNWCCNKCLAFKGNTSKYLFMSSSCNSLYWWIKWLASFGWRWQDLCLLNKQRHNAFHTAKHCIHGTRMPNIDNDNSTRVLSQKLRKVTIYIRSIKSLWNRGWRMVHIRGRLLYISPKGNKEDRMEMQE